MSSSVRLRVYTRKWCGFCAAARRFLDAEKIPYEHHDMTGDRDGIEALKRQWGHGTVPIVILDNTLVGGYTELRAYFQRHGREGLGG